MKTGRIALFVSVVLLMVFVASSLGYAAYPITIKDDLGTTTTLTAAPQRIISLSPSNTEILFALGVGNRVVAVEKNSNYPPAAAQKEKIGSGLKPNLERIVTLQPDLVLLWDLSAKDLQRQLIQLGIPAIAFAPANFMEIYDRIITIGRITATEDAAKTVVDRMKKQVAQVTSTIAKAKTKPNVLFEVWPDPLYTAGPGSFVHEIIQMAGGRNIAEDAASDWPVLSAEVVVVRDPDVILTPFDNNMTVVYGKNKSWFANVKAVKNNRIYQVDQDTISRPGPRLVEGLLTVAKAIHPELFK